MNEKHVTSLSLSQKLKALGVKQESEFEWAQRKYPKELGDRYFKPDLFVDNDKESGLKRLCSAFLASELGEMLPESIPDGIIHQKLFIGKRQLGGYFVRFNDHSPMYDDMLVEVMGKMLVFLLEHKLIDGKDKKV